MDVGSKKVCAYTIELPSVKGRKPEECTTNIERWIYNLYKMRTTTTKLSFLVFGNVFIILLLNHSNSRGLEKKQDLTLLHYHQKMFLIMLLFLSITSPANFETFMTEAM